MPVKACSSAVRAWNNQNELLYNSVSDAELHVGRVGSRVVQLRNWGHYYQHLMDKGYQGTSLVPVVKNPPANAQNTGLIPALGRLHMVQDA